METKRGRNQATFLVRPGAYELPLEREEGTMPIVTKLHSGLRLRINKCEPLVTGAKQNKCHSLERMW